MTPSHDPVALETLASRLVRQSRMNLWFATIFGGGLGAAVADTFHGRLMSWVPMGLLIGSALGDYLSSSMKLPALVALCQLQIVRNPRGDAADRAT